MDTFKFCALQNGYDFTVGNNVRQQQLEGGLPRQVVKFVGAAHKVTVQVSLKDGLERQLFWAFWRLNQTKLWLWKLILDNGGLEDCICQFDADSVPTESYINGKVRRMQFSIFVKPIVRDPDFDRWLIDMWQNGKINTIQDLEKIPNVWMPAATGV
jgi:hypothetical protein